MQYEQQLELLKQVLGILERDLYRAWQGEEMNYCKQAIAKIYRNIEQLKMFVLELRIQD